MKELILDTLGEGIPVIDQELAGMMKKSAMVCLNHHQHQSGVQLRVEPEKIGLCTLRWTGDVTIEMLRQYAGTTAKSKDYEPTTSTTDDAACAIALLFIRDQTEYTAFAKAAIGTTIDYYLMNQAIDSDLIFNASARLEVSGILKATPKNSVQGRLKQKQSRLLDEGLPTFIVIVEFSQPSLLMSSEL